MLVRNANCDARPYLFEDFVCCLEVEVERCDGGRADCKLYDGLRLQLWFCHVKEASGWEPEVCGEVAV